MVINAALAMLNKEVLAMLNKEVGFLNHRYTKMNSLGWKPVVEIQKFKMLEENIW